jgi:hypothetical protein
MTNRPALLIAGRDSTGSRELVAAVHAAKAALDVALAREYAQECALHDAHQAARTAPPEQLGQADAWCAAAGDKLHTAILEVKRATQQLVIAQTSLSLATGSARRSAEAHLVPGRRTVPCPRGCRPPTAEGCAEDPAGPEVGRGACMESPTPLPKPDGSTPI